jgi:SAM-dependent methyltransferase
MSDRRVEPFERHADRYEDWFSRNRSAYLSELDAVRALLPDVVGVEIGVGTGRFAGSLGIGLGIDPSREMLRIARDRGIEVVRGVAEALPLKDSSLGVALLVTTICFVDSPRRAIEEAYRILMPGGSLVIGFIDKTSPLGRQYMERSKESVFYNVATFYSVDELRSHLESAGFRGFDFVQTIYRPLSAITTREQVKDGYGDGSFVVIRATKSID